MFTESSEELSHRYSGTFIGVKDAGGIVPVYVEAFAGGGEFARTLTGMGYFTQGKTISSEGLSRVVAFPDIVWAAPALGYISCRDGVTKFVSRAPEPQPAKMRGLLPALTMYWYPTKDGGFTKKSMLSLFNDGSAAWDAPELYNPSYVSLEAAWASIRNNGRLGAVVCRNIALFKTKLSRKPLVMYKNLVAGLYCKDSNRVFLIPKAHLLFEEISLYAACEKVEAKAEPRGPQPLPVNAFLNNANLEPIEIEELIPDEPHW